MLSVRQGAAAGCALYALRGRAAAGTCKAKVGFHPTSRRTTSAVSAANGGKVPLPGTRSTPFGVARRLIQTGIGWFAKPFTRRTISAASAANECEGITCLCQVTRNDSDEAERRERSPSGVVSAANVEELTGAARQVRGASPAANGSASQVNVSSDTSGEVRTGDRARRRRAGFEKAPPEPSA